ncbi:uncharacterized protein LOC128554558 [Mercenaria mercenaria]|uniref:uncharacterized protein LOC128554558 n=1 Tax=Mercenaria mercenaria TaxID=6596 RepID=UPI00234FAE8A|nr:uncharacterized protein LOC128554558 [Mercenaria mercenaria]
MEGLQEFVDEISKQDFTVMLSTIQKKYQAKYCNGCSLRTLLPAHTSISVMCPLGQKNCNCIDIVGKKPCPSHFCDAMYDEITKRHRYSEPSWWNSNVEKWFQEHWEIAKCFIRYRDTYMGYRDTCMLEMSAAETSTEGLLDVIINNKELQNSVCCEIDPPSDIFSQTRTFISNEDVTDDYKLRTNIDHMISILTDGKYIYRKPAAQKAVRNLLKLRKRVFEKRDFSSFPNPVYDPQTYEGQSLFEDKNWLYPSQHQSIHCSPTDTLDVNVQYTDTALTATGLGEKHDEEETVWSKSKHSEAVKYPSGFHSLRTEHLDISQDTSSETKFNELLLEASKSCKTMEDDSSKISEKDLLCLQSKIEYLSQALETIQTSNIDTTEPLQSDKAKEQVMMFQKEFKSLKDLQKKFVDIKTKFLREIIMKDWQYKAKKEGKTPFSLKIKLI